LFSQDLSVLDYKTEIQESKNTGQTSLDLPKALAGAKNCKTIGWRDLHKEELHPSP
jgi:hypothetical protein